MESGETGFIISLSAAHTGAVEKPLDEAYSAPLLWDWRSAGAAAQPVKTA
jgi:hypothetical protein